MSLLEVKELSIAINKERHLIRVVHGISLTIEKGQTLGIVGESGCGKSLASLAIMGLLAGSQVRVTGGQIVFEGKDLLRESPSKRRALMGSRMTMIFQEPMTSLNPVYRIGDQITEVIHQHQNVSKQQAVARAIALLEQVRIPDPQGKLDFYPHQLSGGMRQRVMIAIALSCNPSLLIADEPTTALDVTVQAQILDLLFELQTRNGMAIMLISHDLGVIAESCQQVAVMYRGRIVERASAEQLFADTRHPYTRGLMRSIPNPDHACETLHAIPGRVPEITDKVPGCAFHPRCQSVQACCRTDSPPLQIIDNNHESLCHLTGADS